jgi:hypothetical protein
MIPELPQFTLEDDLWWTATVLFPSWKGFQSRRGAYGSRDSVSPSDGLVRIVFAPEGRGVEPLTNEELSAIRWVIEHEASLAGALLSSVVKEYPSMQEQYSYSDNEKEEVMPDITSVEDLRALIGLYAVNVHQVQKDGIPYVGFEFGCTWDARARARCSNAWCPNCGDRRRGYSLPVVDRQGRRKQGTLVAKNRIPQRIPCESPTKRSKPTVRTRGPLRGFFVVRQQTTGGVQASRGATIRTDAPFVQR